MMIYLVDRWVNWVIRKCLILLRSLTRIYYSNQNMDLNKSICLLKKINFYIFVYHHQLLMIHSSLASCKNLLQMKYLLFGFCNTIFKLRPTI